MNTSQWLEQRRKGIGGSDAGAICGVSKYKTPYQVWQEKLDLIPAQPDNPAMAYGRMMEPVIRQWYSETTGREVLAHEGIIHHPQFYHLIANLDGFTHDRRVLEIKTARTSAGWGEPGTDEIPLIYTLQVQHYMMITGYEVADVAVSIGGAMPELYEVPADNELQEMLIEREQDFWLLVLSQTPPEPVSYIDMVQRYRTSTPNSVTASDEAVKVHRALIDVRDRIKQLEQDEEELKAYLMGVMGDHDTLTTIDGKPLVSWKTAKASERFDGSAFKAAHPDLYSQFIKAGEPSRRFLIK